VKQEYDTIVKEYCENAHLKGFRKGRVPAEVIIRKLGPSLIDQTRAEVLEKSLAEVFESVEHKPIPYATPEIKSEESLELGKDFSFEVIYDTWPAVQLSPNGRSPTKTWAGSFRASRSRTPSSRTRMKGSWKPATS